MIAKPISVESAIAAIQKGQQVVSIYKGDLFLGRYVANTEKRFAAVLDAARMANATSIRDWVTSEELFKP